MEVLPGIHRVDGVKGANSYLVIGENSIMIVDTGIPGSGKRIMRYIEGLGRNPREVEYIVLTHADFDHTGSALALKERTGAKIAMHGGDVPGASGERESGKVVEFGSPLSRMGKRLARLRSVKADVILEEGDKVSGFRIIHTPGHTEGSICLYRPADALFAGDLVRVDGKGNPKFSWKAFTLDVDQAYESLKKISELQFNVLLPGHGAPLTRDASTRLKVLLQDAGLNSPGIRF